MNENRIIQDLAIERKINIKTAMRTVAAYRAQYGKSTRDKIMFSLLWALEAEVEVDGLMFDIPDGESVVKRVEPTTEDEVVGQEIVAFSKALNTLIMSFEPVLRQYEARIEARKKEWEASDEED